MDNNQLPPGMFTPERPRNANGDSTIDQVASLSPFFDFASTLSPIAPSRALGGQGMGDAGSAHLTALAGARSPTPLCFNSPNAHKSAALAGKSGGDRKRSNLSKGEQPAALEEVALSASADVLHSVSAFAQSPLRPGVLDDITDVASVAALRKQLESDFNVDLTEPEAGGARSMSTLEKELLQLDADLGLDGGLMPRLRSPGHITQRAGSRPGVRGAAARGGAPAGVGAVADMAAAIAGEANKRSSATGASTEFPHGLSKINKKGGEDSPRAGAHLVGARSDRGKRSKKSAAAALLEEELQRAGRPSSAPASGRGGARGASSASKGHAKTTDRRLSVQPSATPLAKGERPPRHSLDSLGGDALCGVADDAEGLGGLPPATCGSKKCNCKKSKCLKLYCECFAAGAFCDECNCQNCCNTSADANLVAATRHQIELRNPQAFADKITEDGGDGEARHKKGCHCKKSACLKKYCECFQAGVPCQEYCKCEGCKNTAGAGPHAGNGGAARGEGAKSAVRAPSHAKRTGVSVMTAAPALGGLLATPTRMAQQAAAVAAAERAALFMTDDLMIEDFARDFDGDGLDGMKSPGRAGSAVLAAAADIGLDLLQSPPKLMGAITGHGGRLSEGAAEAAGASGGAEANDEYARGEHGVASLASSAMATPMKRGEMSPITPGSRSKVQGTPGSTILRAGPGRLTLNGAPNTRSKQAAPPPRFSDAASARTAKATPVKTPAAGTGAAARFEVTPKLTRSAKTRSQFGSLPGSHDALTGGMIATLGSPTPLSTPEGFE